MKSLISNFENNLQSNSSYVSFSPFMIKKSLNEMTSPEKRRKQIMKFQNDETYKRKFHYVDEFAHHVCCFVHFDMVECFNVYIRID